MPVHLEPDPPRPRVTGYVEPPPDPHGDWNEGPEWFDILGKLIALGLAAGLGYLFGSF